MQPIPRIQQPNPFRQLLPLVDPSVLFSQQRQPQIPQNTSSSFQPQPQAFSQSQLKLSVVSNALNSNPGPLPSTNWNNLKIMHSALNIIGTQFRTPELGNGTLACAWAVSTALDQAGMISRKSSGCDRLKGILSKDGFSNFTMNPNQFEPHLYTPGDVIFFGKNKNGHGHVGIISKVTHNPEGTIDVFMVHNSSSKREVVEVKLNNYYKKPISIYRKL